MSGIGIREFREKLLDDLSKTEYSGHSIKGFQKACKLFMSRVKNDNEAKAFANLCDLNHYRKEPWKFADQVAHAIEFIENRKRNRALRKGRKIKGIYVLYEDEKCFITSPKNHKFSRKAAYLDNGTANWCVAGYGVKGTWDSYSVNTMFYVYLKSGKSWAAVLKHEDAYALKNSLPTSLGIPVSIIENRNNDCHGNADKIRGVYAEMLSETGLSNELFESIVKKRIKYKTFDYEKVALQAVQKKDFEAFYECAKKTKGFKNPSNHKVNLLLGVVKSCNLEAVKYTYENTSLPYGYYENPNSPIDSTVTALSVVKLDVKPRMLNTLREAISVPLKKENRDVIEYLMSKGQDLNEFNGASFPILGDGLYQGLDLEEFRYLEGKGADIYALDLRGRNFTLKCRKDRNLPCLKYLESKGVLLSKNSRGDIVEFLLDVASDIDIGLEGGTSKTLEYLLKKGEVSPNEKLSQMYDVTVFWLLMARLSKYCCTYNRDRDEPLRRKQLKLIISKLFKNVKIFLKYGADVNAAGEGYDTPLDFAIQLLAYPVIAFLLKRGAKHSGAIKLAKGDVEKIPEKFKSLFKKNGITVFNPKIKASKVEAICCVND